LIVAASSLADLTKTAAAAAEPTFVVATTPKLGGVDPLGMRQINFDLMDQVIPGLNNVARHIRPFVVVTWAWRRARQIAEMQGVRHVNVDDLRDFVDRIEVIYAWSQFLRNPNADLPGRQVLLPFVQSDGWTFGGKAWLRFRETRRYSTAFTAPITYGPSLKTLGWLTPHREDREVLIPTPTSVSALDAFEARIKRRLDHPAFSNFGKVTVTTREVRNWSGAWALDEATQPEKQVMAQMLLGSGAPMARRRGCELMLAAVVHAGTADVAHVRQTMAGAPSNFHPRAALVGAFEAWRRIQVRQLFRLSLESLLYWTIWQITENPQSSSALVAAFLRQVGRRHLRTAREWLNAAGNTAIGPTALMDRIARAFEEVSQTKLASAIADSLSFCIREAPDHEELFERSDRLPLFRARREAEAWGTASTRSFVRHILESWVLAQHVYWSVGRGLADARARGKTILRLKIVLEEEGWTLAPGASLGRAPAPSGDRLETALTLATECGLVSVNG
jgi:hypothetical protein